MGDQRATQFLIDGRPFWRPIIFNFFQHCITSYPLSRFPSYLAQIFPNAIWCVMNFIFMKISNFGILMEFWILNTRVKSVISCPEHNFITTRPIPFILGTDIPQYHMMCHEFQLFENFRFLNFDGILNIRVKSILSCPEHNFIPTRPIPFIFGTDIPQYHMMCHEFQFFWKFQISEFWWNFE